VTESAEFSAYVAGRQSALLRVGWLLTGDVHSAEDLVQAALVKVWPHWHRVAGVSDPDAYVRRTMLTTYLTWRRRHWHRERPLGQLPDRPTPGDPYASVDLRDSLARLLPRLPARQRAVLVLRFYEDLSEAQTADAMGCTVGTVKSQTFKALTTLRAAIGAEPVGKETV